MINENNLSISESQGVNELNIEELDSIAGGGLLAGFVGAIGGYTVARLSGASIADSMKAGAAVGTFGLAIPEP